MNSSVKKLLRNIFANQLGFLVSVVVTFFLSPYVVNSLGGTRYGIWSLIVSLTGNYGLLAFGIQGAVTRYIAHAAATGDREKVNGYFNTALFFLAGSATLVLLVGLVMTLFINYLFVLPKDFVSEAKLACLLVTLSAVTTFCFASFDCVLIAHQRFQATNVVGTVNTIIRAGLTVWFLKHGYGIVALAALGTVLTLLNGLVIATIVKKMFSWIKTSYKLTQRCYLNELVSYGHKSFTVGIAISLIYQCDLMVIGTSLSMDRVAIYSLAATLVTYLVQFVNSISIAFDPYITGLCALDKKEDIRKLYVNGSCIMYMLAGLIVAGCLVFGQDFFTLWVGPKYAECANILSILVIPQFFGAGARVGRSILVGMAKIGPLAFAVLCEGIFNLILSLILVQYYGLIGVAIGTLVPNIVNNGVWLPIYVSRIIKVKISSFLLKAIAPGVGIGLLVLAISYWVKGVFTPASWSVFALDILVVVSISLVSMFTFLSCLNCDSYLRIVVSKLRSGH